MESLPQVSRTIQEATWGKFAIGTGFSCGCLEGGFLGCESALNEGLPHPWGPWGWLCFWKRVVMPQRLGLVEVLGSLTGEA